MRLGRLAVSEDGQVIAFHGWPYEGNFLVACGEEITAFMQEVVRRWNLQEDVTE